MSAQAGLGDDRSNPQNEAQRTFEEIERRRGAVGDGFAVLVAGYPGAGKTTFAEQAAQQLRDSTDAEVVNVELDAAEDEVAADVDDPRRDPKVFTAAVAEEYGLRSSDVAVIDGVASMEEISSIAPFFDWLAIVYVKAHHAARHHRLIEAEEASDEPDLESVSRDALRQLDDEARDSGLHAIEAADFFDITVENELTDLGEFRAYSRYVTRTLYQEYETEMQ